MRCLIVDDEPLAHDVIANYLSEVPFLELAGQMLPRYRRAGISKQIRD